MEDKLKEKVNFQFLAVEVETSLERAEDGGKFTLIKKIKGEKR